MKRDVVVCSFYTADDYYRQQGEELKESLEALGIECVVKEVEIPLGKDWADICRQKIQFLHDVYFSNPGKMVFWIDADCRLQDFPDFIKASSADVIGFQRGFSTPMRIGYRYRSRFWEPCFIGINATPGGERFIEDALIAEKRYTDKATDDYFFEESWRLNSRYLSFQIIPSAFVAKDESKITPRTLFLFGSSGNVAEFKGKVSQHSSDGKKNTVSRVVNARHALVSMAKEVLPDSLKPMLKKLKGKIQNHGVSEVTKEVLEKRFYSKCLAAGVSGDSSTYEKLQKIYLKEKEGGVVSRRKENELTRAAALLSYRNMYEGSESLALSWWVHPAPGNFGDWLSPYIFAKSSGRNVHYSSFNQAENQPHVLGVGSIAKFATRESTVIGSGVSRLDTPLSSDANYLLVRGPYTADAIKASGGSFDGGFGDPGVVMPLLYSPSADLTRRAEIGLVRHFSHFSVPLLLPDNVEEFSVLVSTPEGVEGFIDRLHQYEIIITSAMHVVVMCVAYGIPHRLISFKGLEEAVSGDGIKYRDFYSGVGLTERSPLAVRRNLTEVNLRDMAVDDSLSFDRLKEVYHFVESGVSNALYGRRPPVS
ncbi:MAG: hypothetical protein ACQEXO_17060 [Pseudomonadota bacterium]